MHTTDGVVADLERQGYVVVFKTLSADSGVSGHILAEKD